MTIVKDCAPSDKKFARDDQKQVQNYDVCAERS